MAAQADAGGKDDVKTQFVTREGTYRLMPLSEYSRPNRVGYTGGAGASHTRVSLVALPPPGPQPAAPAQPAPAEQDPPAPPAPAEGPPDERICFNHGKELYVYVYRGVKKAADLTKPVDKKMYKGTNPTCHDFNTVTMTADSVALVIGFSTGQIQLIDPIKKELSKLYNEERLIDKSRVTCIRWVPGSSTLFAAAHASGHLYVYNEELAGAGGGGGGGGGGGAGGAPAYQPLKRGAGYSVHTCRAKTPRNPLYRWVVGPEGASSCINEFAWSPCGDRLATASQDGVLRVFHYPSLSAEGRARSYFGGFLCVCWSADGRVVAAGGEDDLVTVWALCPGPGSGPGAGPGLGRVVARAQGHRSWVAAVAFDQHAFAAPDAGYRLASVSQDTQLCLWDITEDVLRPAARGRASAHLSPPAAAPAEPASQCAPPASPAPAAPAHNGVPARAKHARLTDPKPKANSVAALTISVGRAKEDAAGGGNSLTARLAGFSFGDRRSDHRRHFSLTGKAAAGAEGGGRGRSAGAGAAAGAGAGAGAGDDPSDALKLIGTAACPRFDECPVLEPLVCKKIAHERLTALVFRPDCFLTACADGCVNTWARPARAHPAPNPAPNSTANPAANTAASHRRVERIDLTD